MNARLIINSIGPGSSLQDRGREELLGFGLSQGGAMDLQALAEGAVLLGDPQGTALAVELPGGGGTFRAEGASLLIAVTGAPAQASIDGQNLVWPGAYLLAQGSELTISGGAGYSYLSVAGLAAPEIMGAVSAHLTGGVGRALLAGDALACSPAPNPGGMTLPLDNRFLGGEIRVLPSVQTEFFGAEVLARFQNTEFTKDLRASRMGARMGFDGAGFSSSEHLSVVSEFVLPGDIQIIGDGAPFVLFGECQSMGGYPRIAHVISADLACVAQAPPGAKLRFRFVELEEALAAQRQMKQALRDLSNRLTPLVRDPSDIPDLLSYQLVGGVISAQDEREEF